MPSPDSGIYHITVSSPDSGPLIATFHIPDESNNDSAQWSFTPQKGEGKGSVAPVKYKVENIGNGQVTISVHFDDESKASSAGLNAAGTTGDITSTGTWSLEHLNGNTYTFTPHSGTE